MRYNIFMTKTLFPETTLFLITSVDGKISSGDSDQLDVDRDWKSISGVKEGLQQYYDLEKQTDLYSLNTGRVMAKVGINERKNIPTKMPFSFILIDNHPHLNAKGITYLSGWLNRLYLVTTNKKHPAYALKEKLKNIDIIEFGKKIDFKELFQCLRKKYGIKRMTIQSGGTLNATLVREDLIDHLSLVIAPLLVGGATTSSLVDGVAIYSVKELFKLKALKLKNCKKLKHSYLHLKYDLIKKK